MKSLALAMLLLLCACGSVGRPIGPGVSPQPSPQLSETDLKYRLVDGLGAPVYCDPSEYPVARVEDPAAVAQQVAALRSQNPSVFDAIIRHEHLDPANLSPADNLRIRRQASALAAVPLTAEGPLYRFQYEVVGPPSVQVMGTVDGQGIVKVDSRVPAQRHQCPICMAEWTHIATPGGVVPVTEIQVGTFVWTLDGDGRRVAAPVVRVGHTPTPVGHRVVHLRLEDGRTLDVSPGHFLATGRAVGELAPGDRLDGSVVVSVERTTYGGAATWDLLPAGPTHLYWANDVPLRSTIE